MKRSKELLAKRKEFVENYVKENSHKKMKNIIAELIERLYISETTIYNILRDGN